jgi:riboflavin biosynthesis pyrimidine reductase
MFADEIDASIDRVAPPTNEQARWMVEMLRERLDKLMYGIRTRLAETSRQQGNPAT